MRRARWLETARLRLAALLALDERQVVLLWAGVVGLVGAAAAVGFDAAVDGLKLLLTGQRGSIAEAAAHLAWWQRLLFPAAGGLVAGLVLHLGRRLARGERGADFLEAIALGDGVIPPRPGLVRTASSLATIVTGGAVGREGPIVQLAALLASLVGRARGASTPRLRLLVACGAAAGVAAAYNTPIGGALFVAEILLGSVAIGSFGPLILASVVAVFVVQQVHGVGPRFEAPPFHLVSLWEVLPYLALGLAAGVTGPWFLLVLRAARRLFARIPGPLPVRFVAGGLVVGGLSIAVPEVWGSGLGHQNAILSNEWFWGPLLLVLACKVLAIAATVGSGAVGGIFAPTLFVGAVIGSLLGKAFHAAAPGLTAAPPAYALVGMGCFLAATTHAPLMAIVMVFEMTLDYAIVLPLMLGCVTAAYTAQGIEPESVYAPSLARQREPGPGVSIPDLRVGDLMRPPPGAIRADAPFGAVADAFMNEARYKYLYVTDADGRFLGAVAFHDVKANLADGDLGEAVRAVDLVRSDFPVLTPDERLVDALDRFARHDGERIPVVSDQESRRLVGVLSKTDLLLTLSQGSRPVI